MNIKTFYLLSRNIFELLDVMITITKVMVQIAKHRWQKKI